MTLFQDSLVDDDSTLYFVYFISGCIWIPYTILIFILFFEQFLAGRFPQFLLLLCFAIGCCIRCVWFWGLSYQSSDVVAYTVLDRLAILFQFSAISFLTLMWARVLKASRSRPDVIATDATSNPLGMSDASISSFSTATAPILTPSSEISKRSAVVLRVVIVVNVLVWIFILITIVASVKRNSDSLYKVNLIFVASLCAIQGIVVLVVGLRTGLQIHENLSPVYVSSRSSPALATGSDRTGFCACCCQCYKFMMNKPTSRNR